MTIAPTHDGNNPRITLNWAYTSAKKRECARKWVEAEAIAQIQKNRPELAVKQMGVSGLPTHLIKTHL